MSSFVLFSRKCLLTRILKAAFKKQAQFISPLLQFPIPGLGTLISGLIAEDASDVTKVGILQMILNLPWFLLFLPLVIIPFIGALCYLSSIGVYLLVHVCNIAFGVVWGIKTYKVAAAVSGGSAVASAPMEM